LSNYIFMLMKDMVKIYKVYHMIVQEILERFPTLKKDQCQDAYRVYADFCEDTPKIKKVITRMVDTFNFPIKKPSFYVPDKSLLETL
jgi:hypothetical protein